MASRGERARTAEETVAILGAGTYRAPSGRMVDLQDSLRDSKAKTLLIRADDWETILQQTRTKLANRHHPTTFEVANETTLAAARRLVERLGSGQVAALNFASAKNPGGGFLGGSQAQEESLARATGLYATLLEQPDYYQVNRNANALYTDHLIISPGVPVFRDDNDALLEEPYEVTFLTYPAPNAGAVAQNSPTLASMIEPTLRRRIEHILSAAVHMDQTALVLGAWGCGVFKNSPETVARIFADFLLSPGTFAQAFEHVSFAVLDRSGETIAPFRALFVT